MHSAWHMLTHGGLTMISRGMRRKARQRSPARAVHVRDSEVCKIGILNPVPVHVATCAMRLYVSDV